MNITSIKYLVFTVAVLCIYAIIPSRYRWLLLLTASYLFYSSLNAPYLLLALAVVTISTYLCGLGIDSAVSPTRKKKYFWAGVIGNLFVLAGLKYLPFINENINNLAKALNTQMDFSIGFQFVAIGVSYFVFQAIAYLADIYLETLKPEKNLGHFALSMSFFPKLLQGPIERGESILPSMRQLTNIEWGNLKVGAHLFLWGLFKKVVVADRLASFVDPIYSDVSGNYGLSFIIATYLFAFQLYFDFSGYTDMARGMARCFNIKLTENFNSPYLAKSTAEFWRRWHISFSRWILDYLFKPIQFSLRYWLRWGAPIALIVTFLASGLWHGAAWTYVFWGLLHGIYLSTGVFFKKQIKGFYKSIGLNNTKLLDWWNVFATFHMICFAWVFFRATTLMNGFQIIKSSIIDLPQSLMLLSEDRLAWYEHLMLGQSHLEFSGVILLIILVAYLPEMGKIKSYPEPVVEDMAWFLRLPYWCKGVGYGVIIYLIAFCGASTQSFIYMQF